MEEYFLPMCREVSVPLYGYLKVVNFTVSEKN